MYMVKFDECVVVEDACGGAVVLTFRCSQVSVMDHAGYWMGALIGPWPVACDQVDQVVGWLGRLGL